jgi:hypothetical protein
MVSRPFSTVVTHTWSILTCCRAGDGGGRIPAVPATAVGAVRRRENESCPTRSTQPRWQGQGQAPPLLVSLAHPQGNNLPVCWQKAPQ